MQIRQLSTVGQLVGTLFFAFSLTPSLLPRPWVSQGVVSGLSFTFGYALGWAGRWLWSYLELPLPRARTELIATRVAATICLVIAATFLWRASEWQNSVRALMEMEKVSGVRPFGVALLALLVFGAILLAGRLFRRTFRFLSGRFRWFVPRRLANVIGGIAAIAFFWTIADGVIITLIVRVADGISQQVDAMIEPDTERPNDPMKTGSPKSLIAWEDLGLQGRAFISSAPTAEELREFFGEPVPEPIRVYVGLNAAESPEARARLALEELKRVNAFERSMLLVVTPTGTGWIDPAALNSVEYLHRGNIATVAVQYSYLPSVLALPVEGAYGAESARALFQEVYGYWTKLPQNNRPDLYLFGLSLGALNSSLSFDAHDILADPFQGALWTGPPFRSELWNRITVGREPDSPFWLPLFRDGSVIRFMNQHGGLKSPGTAWGPFRIAFVQYASDPMTFFSLRSFYKEPEWMREPRGPDVSPELRWYPAVTLLQLAADMVVATTPHPGYGHNFAAEHYIDAWLALTEPEGWTKEDIRRLKSLLASQQEKSLR
jgi:uncharacterized membrane protein